MLAFRALRVVANAVSLLGAVVSVCYLATSYDPVLQPHFPCNCRVVTATLLDTFVQPNWWTSDDVTYSTFLRQGSDRLCHVGNMYPTPAAAYGQIGEVHQIYDCEASWWLHPCETDESLGNRGSIGVKLMLVTAVLDYLTRMLGCWLVYAS
jgi:hypothetical protein